MAVVSTVARRSRRRVNDLRVVEQPAPASEVIDLDAWAREYASVVRRVVEARRAAAAAPLDEPLRRAS